MVTADDIKDFRKKFNLRQRELASILGVSTGTIQNYERGEAIPNSKKWLLREMINKSKTEGGFSFTNISNLGFVKDGNIEKTNIVNNQLPIDQEKDTKIALLENEIKYLRTLVEEKERFIQNLLNK